jgi:hypothetical protein
MSGPTVSFATPSQADSNPRSLAEEIQPVAGVDANGKAQLLRVSESGALSSNIPGFDIPPHDEIETSYVGDTNNFDTVVYKSGGAIVRTLTFAYVGGTPTQDDARLASISAS